MREGAFEPLLGKDGRPYFVLKAGNGQTIGQSQMYAHRSSVYVGIKSVMANAPGAETVSSGE